MLALIVGTASFTAGPAFVPSMTQRATPVMQSVHWDRHAGGCTPFAEFNGGGSAAVGSGVQPKWAQGGDNHIRRENPTDTHMTTPPVDASQVAVTSQAAPAGVVEPTRRPYSVLDHHGNSATPFAPFNGGGSSCDQLKWAQGGDWDRRMAQ